MESYTPSLATKGESPMESGNTMTMREKYAKSKAIKRANYMANSGKKYLEIVENIQLLSTMTMTNLPENGKKYGKMDLSSLKKNIRTKVLILKESSSAMERWKVKYPIRILSYMVLEKNIMMRESLSVRILMTKTN